MIKRFEHSPYLGYTSKQVHNEPTEAYFFLIKYITKKIKSEKHLQLRTRGVKLSVKGKIGHINKTIGHVNKAIQYNELEGVNGDKQISSPYDIKGKENTSSTTDKRGKARDGYVHMYEYGKDLLCSTYKCACTRQP